MTEELYGYLALACYVLAPVVFCFLMLPKKGIR